ncbi:MAG: DUF3298 domain-containing protein [Porphyromonadaceae bacterium]|nr:DUF3298 domain-containing protein [Porphyromonadaceae bacterium]
MENFVFEDVYPLTADTAFGALSFEADVEIPTKFRDHDILKNLQKQIVAKVFGELYNSLPIDSILPKYAKVLSIEYIKSNEPYIQKLIEVNETGESLQNLIQIQGVAMYTDDKILSYSYERFAYMGGKHGNSSRLFFNFNLDNAKLISEKDIFIDGYENPLTQLIKQQIVEDNAELESVADLSEFHFFEDRITPNNNFFVNSDGLVYVYNPYEIVPYNTGQIEVPLTFERLKPILKSNNLFAHFYTVP